MNTPNLLSEHEHRRFSITWLDGLIRVRSGGQNGVVLMEWRDENPIGVGYMGVRTGWGATGNWKLHFEHYPAVAGSKRNGNLSVERSATREIGIGAEVRRDPSLRDRQRARAHRSRRTRHRRSRRSSNSSSGFWTYVNPCIRLSRIRSRAESSRSVRKPSLRIKQALRAVRLTIDTFETRAAYAP